MSSLRHVVRLCLVALACSAAGLGLAVASADDAGTRPPECSRWFGDPNVRERIIDKQGGTYLHEMSNPPICAASGPLLGTMNYRSRFNVYYADPRGSWCYGFSVQLGRRGYVLCSSLGMP